MHSPLNPHLHTEECNVIIAALVKCHDENSKLKQLFGVCNELDTAMRRCTKAERLERTKENRAKAMAREQALKEKYLQGKASGNQF